MNTGYSLNRTQGGAALVVGLMILVVMVMLGLVSSQSAILQQRLAGNFRDVSLAFESAEAGGRWSMAWLQSLGSTPLGRPFPCVADCDSNSRVWITGIHPARPAATDTLWSAARAYGINPTDDSNEGVSVPLVKSNPKFIMEQQYFRRDDLAGDPQKGVAFYRVTSRGLGARDKSRAVVRAVMAKRFE